MAQTAQIPIRNDEHANAEATGKVRADKEREVHDGHDGTWVAHPGLVELARGVFDATMPGPNQIDRPLDDDPIAADDLLVVPAGTITEAGLRHNLHVGILYVEAWLRGVGCVPLYNLMEDAATAEICRAQLWQWIQHGSRLDDGRRIDLPWVRKLAHEELASIRSRFTPEQLATMRLSEAAELFEELISQEEFAEFLTVPAYERLTASNVSKE